MDTNKAVWNLFDRQVRSDSFTLSIATLLIAVTSLQGTTRLTGWLEGLVGLIAVLSSVLLWWGWWGQSLRIGLLGTVCAAWCWSTLAFAGILQKVSVTTWGIAGCWAMLGVLLWLRDRHEEP